MAHRETIQDPTFQYLLHGEPFFWTVSSSVGYGCRNKPEDVLLVQFFINSIIREVNDSIIVDIIAGTEERVTPFKGVPNKLEPDGDFGGKTWGAIKWLQKKSGYCVVDGMVSASDGTKALTKKSKKWYTIHILNHFYHSCFPHYFSDIRCDSTLPALLGNHLSGPLPDLV